MQTYKTLAYKAWRTFELNLDKIEQSKIKKCVIQIIVNNPRLEIMNTEITKLMLISDYEYSPIHLAYQ